MEYLPFPNIDPVAFSIGPLVVRWYALAYLAGFFIGWKYCCWLVKRMEWSLLNTKLLDDLLLWVMVGVVFGGRIGYILFYQFEYYLDNPLNALKVWQGGMSFHGGLLGVLIASALFARLHKIKFFDVTDILACATPIGIFFGRIANFINGELYGRTAENVAWAFIFPSSDGQPRHPSQLYEALLEGLVLFVVLFIVARFSKLARHVGFISGLFLIQYAGYRFIVEFYREPDAHIGYIAQYFTMGQLLCVPMFIAGCIIALWALKKPKAEAA